jgi:hypothetical protein
VLRAPRWLAAAAAGGVGVAGALGAGACAGQDEIPPTITTNVGAAPSRAGTASTASTAPAPSAPATGSTAATATGAPGATATGKIQPGGAGDEEGTRVPASFQLRGGRLLPRTVSVPAFLAAEVTVASSDARPHAVQVKVGKGYALQVPAHGTASARVPGQKTGRVPVLVDGRAAAFLVWGGEPGP